MRPDERSRLRLEHQPKGRWHRFVRSLVVFDLTVATLLVLPESRAHARSENELPPGDVSVIVQPAAATLGPLPNEFQRIDAGWLALEFPGSARSRVEPLVREAETIRTHLAEDLDNPCWRTRSCASRGPPTRWRSSPRGVRPRRNTPLESRIPRNT